ncbi:ribonuclease D [Actinomadura geliboluensis]|uniref:ribonuclease D n=1 Tax=Actinomadura geliboluensis TaxID=882440 RepID=UPI0036829304
MDVELHSDDLPIDLSLQLRGAKVVACDIETSGLDWRADYIGMCQFYSPEHGAFLVKVGPRSQVPRGIKALVEDPHTLKIFHHAPFDLRFLRYAWGIRAQSVACTKVASKIAYPAKCKEDHSLRNLVQDHLGISLDKTEQASNWLASNLTPDQLSYACNDVRFLIELHSFLQAEIVSLGFQELYERCCNFLPSHVELQVNDREEVFAY